MGLDYSYVWFPTWDMWTKYEERMHTRSTIFIRRVMRSVSSCLIDLIGRGVGRADWFIYCALKKGTGMLFHLVRWKVLYFVWVVAIDFFGMVQKRYIFRRLVLIVVRQWYYMYPMDRSITMKRYFFTLLLRIIWVLPIDFFMGPKKRYLLFVWSNDRYTQRKKVLLIL